MYCFISQMATKANILPGWCQQHLPGPPGKLKCLNILTIFYCFSQHISSELDQKCSTCNMYPIVLGCQRPRQQFSSLYWFVFVLVIYLVYLKVRIMEQGKQYLCTHIHTHTHIHKHTCTKIFIPLVHSSNDCKDQSQTKSKSRSKNSIWVSYVEDRSTSMWPILYFFPPCYLAKTIQEVEYAGLDLALCRMC